MHHLPELFRVQGFKNHNNQYHNNQYHNNQYHNNQYHNNQYHNNQYHNNQYHNNQYTDPYNEKRQRVILVNAMLGAKDGMEDFVLMSDDMESHRFNPDEEFSNFRGQLIVKVPSLTVVTFAKKYSVPTNFGILSIDAEGGQPVYNLTKKMC
nr:hypothetical protein BaRGS_015554 [Batillaria attramentaria]